MIHLMELPNPDPTELAARPGHGGRDRHMYAALPSGVFPSLKVLSRGVCEYVRRERDAGAYVYAAPPLFQPWKGGRSPSGRRVRGYAKGG